MKYVVAILGLAVLMVVHEAGHYFAARAGGLRVTKFSIGFGPTLFKILPDGGYWTFFALGDRLKFRLFKHTTVEAAPGAETKMRVTSARAAERAAHDRASSERVSAERAAAEATAQAERAALELATAEGSN